MYWWKQYEKLGWTANNCDAMVCTLMEKITSNNIMLTNASKWIQDLINTLVIVISCLLYTSKDYSFAKNSLLWSNKMKLQTKLTVYISIVEPILTYGCECWQLSDKEKKMIETVEMNFLRRAYNISRIQHVRNEDIRRKTGRIFTTCLLYTSRCV